MGANQSVPKNKEFWEDVVKKYRSVDEAGKDLHMHYTTVKKYVTRFNLSFPAKKATHKRTTVIEQIIQLPPVELQVYKHPIARIGDEEEAILHLSDGHAGKITVSFNDDVYNMRMANIFDGVMTIITLHRKLYPIRKLHIVITGDNVQGENPFQGSTVGSVSMGARDQVSKIAFPAMVKLIASLAQEFEEIIVECVAGNHGANKIMSATNKEDLRLYDMLKVYFAPHASIKINIHETPSAIVYINGFKSFIFHGDYIKSNQSVPLVAIKRKLTDWYIQYDRFQYAFGGHFHKRLTDEIGSRLEYFMCGTLVSDDDWAINTIGISSNPSQGLYGIHPKRGITWRYSLQVDKNFLPEKEDKKVIK